MSGELKDAVERISEEQLSGIEHAFSEYPGTAISAFVGGLLVPAVPALIAELRATQFEREDAFEHIGSWRRRATKAEAALVAAEERERVLERLLGVETINGVRGYCCHDHCSCGGDVPAVRQTCGSWFTLTPETRHAE